MGRIHLANFGKRAEVASYAKNGERMVLEIKGEDSDQNRANRLALDAWVLAVNARGGFGVWCWDVVKGEPSKVDDVLIHHAQSAAVSAPMGEGVLVLASG